jgi:hypothetical protein
MIVVVTSLELKSPFTFFALSYNAMKIIRQMKQTSCVAYKSTGFWTSHYTMSLWKSADEMKQFARSGSHLQAMKKSSLIAREIRTLVVEADALPSWAVAKERLRTDGKLLTF